MEKGRLFDSIDGLFAYDTGCTDSGIHDETLRQEVKNHLLSITDDEFRYTISEYVRDYFLSVEALDEGYGIEGVREFIEWMSNYMDIDI